MKGHIAVIGIGNVLCSDEGVGIHVINRLKRMKLPRNVQLFDCGTNAIAVLEAMDGAKKAILIDATSSGGRPGTVRLYRVGQLSKMEDGLLNLVSLHQFDLITALKVAKLTGAYNIPDGLVVIGVEVKSLESSPELSEEVRAAIPKVVEMVIREILDDS